MGRGAQSLARVAVVVRAGAGPLWWLGAIAAVIGVWLPGLTGRRIGLSAGALLFLLTAVVVARARHGRYAGLARDAVRAGRGDFLQDRAVTARNWRRARRWWLLLAFLAAIGSSFALPAAGGAAMAGAGAGLRLKAAWLGRLERTGETLLWVSADRLAGGPAGRPVTRYVRTGTEAGDAAPGGARRRR